MLDKMGLRDYIITQICLIPSYIYGVVLVIFIVGCIILVVMKQSRQLEKMLLLLLFEYIYMIFGTTVIFRQSLPDRQFYLIPFWSYAEKPYGHVLLLPETIVNICMFVPIGFLSCFILKSTDWRKVLLVGAVISLAIEISQFIFLKGFSEFDDVFHNTLGSMIGFIIYKFVNCIQYP